MDWVTVIRDEAEKSSILRADELAQKYHVGPTTVTQALSRQSERGLVEHVGRKIYFNRLALEASPRDLVNVLRTRAYISLESALREYGISTQSPRILTCVTVERPYEFKGKSIAITYRGINPNLYWGFKEKQSRYSSYQIAEPEKAILDWTYLNLQNGIEPALDELDFRHVSRSRLMEYAQRFPSTVMKSLLPVLITDSLAA
jgi:predicted transcriptional regulator of viral defense system